MSILHLDETKENMLNFKNDYQKEGWSPLFTPHPKFTQQSSHKSKDQKPKKNFLEYDSSNDIEKNNRRRDITKEDGQLSFGIYEREEDLNSVSSDYKERPIIKGKKKKTKKSNDFK